MAEAWRAHLRPVLRELSAYDVAPTEAFARLHANECPEPWPAHVMDALAEVVRATELGRYPDTSGRRLRAILGERYRCHPDRVVLGNGSDEVISILLTALAGASRPRVVVPVPTFVMYDHTARVLGYEVASVPLASDFALPVDALHSALAGATVCFLARPNNPTGTVWDAAAIADLVTRHPEVVFVIDEAYGPYAPGTSLWAPDGPDNIVHMATLSKVGLAALRVGYAIAHPDLAAAMHKVRHPYNVSQTSLALAEAVLVRFAAAQAELIARTIANRERLSALLGQIGGATVFPSGANFVLVRLASPSIAEALVEALARRDIVIKDVGRAPGLAACVRVGVGTSAELDHLAAALADLRTIGSNTPMST